MNRRDEKGTYREGCRKTKEKGTKTRRGLSARLIALGFLILMLAGCAGCSTAELAQEAFYGQIGNILVGKAKDVKSISTDRYAYSQLDEETQKVYDQILDCILKHEESAAISTQSEDVLTRAYNCIFMDYGGLFWVHGYRYHTYSSFGHVVGMEIEPKYVYSKEETKKLQKQVDAVVEEWLAGISPGDSDYAKAKYVFDTLISKVNYKIESRDNQNILSVFLYGETVCQGYADATQYLLQYLGVPATVITGEADGSSHAWNMVCLDGTYYYTDTTWGNSAYQVQDGVEERSMDYSYLNATSQELAQTHTPQTEISLPESTSIDDTYFCREGLYFTAYDGAAIGQRIRQARQEGQKRVTIKLADEEVYARTLDAYITNNHFFTYNRDLSSISYIDDEKMKTITFIFQ